MKTQKKILLCIVIYALLTIVATIFYPASIDLDKNFRVAIVIALGPITSLFTHMGLLLFPLFTLIVLPLITSASVVNRNRLPLGFFVLIIWLSMGYFLADLLVAQ